MEYTYVTKVKKNFNVAINCKINLQGNLAIIYVHPRNHNLLHRLIKEQIFQTNRTIYHVNNHLMMIRDTKYSELNSFR